MENRDFLFIDVNCISHTCKNCGNILVIKSSEDLSEKTLGAFLREMHSYDTLDELQRYVHEQGKVINVEIINNKPCEPDTHSTRKIEPDSTSGLASYVLQEYYAK